MVVPFIDHGNSVPDTCVGGLFRASKRSNSRYLFIFAHSNARMQVSTSISALLVERTMIPLAARTGPVFLNLDKRAVLASRMRISEIFSIGNIFGWLRPSEIFSFRNSFTRKLSERTKG